MELLAPAGNLEKLKAAVLFGADAVYCGAGSFSLRAESASLSLDELSAGIRFARERGCRVYLAMNIFPFDNDLEEIAQYLGEAVKLGIDAVIISDPGLLALVRRRGGGVKIHLSTQANTTNSESARFWHEQGVSRIVAARELSLSRIRAIKDKNPGLEIEVFVHGAMCIAYSGRCFLSQYLNERSANRGECSQPCRFEYELREVGREDRFTVGEEGRGAYILNSRDLCMIGHIPELAASGVDSLKIEGRMKTLYYTAAVTRVYRQALDAYCGSAGPYEYKPRWLEELRRVPHRPYTTGFYLPGGAQPMEYTEDAGTVRLYDFVGLVKEYDPLTGRLNVLARNRFSVGDRLEILVPGIPEVAEIEVAGITEAETGRNLASAHNSYIVNVYPAANPGIAPVPDAVIRRKNPC